MKQTRQDQKKQVQQILTNSLTSPKAFEQIEQVLMQASDGDPIAIKLSIQTIYENISSIQVKPLIKYFSLMYFKRLIETFNDQIISQLSSTLLQSVETLALSSLDQQSLQTYKEQFKTDLETDHQCTQLFQLLFECIWVWSKWFPINPVTNKLSLFKITQTKLSLLGVNFSKVEIFDKKLVWDHLPATYCPIEMLSEMLIVIKGHPNMLTKQIESQLLKTLKSIHIQEKLQNYQSYSYKLFKWVKKLKKFNFNIDNPFQEIAIQDSEDEQKLGQEEEQQKNKSKQKGEGGTQKKEKKSKHSPSKKTDQMFMKKKQKGNLQAQLEDAINKEETNGNTKPLLQLQDENKNLKSELNKVFEQQYIYIFNQTKVDLKIVQTNHEKQSDLLGKLQTHFIDHSSQIVQIQQQSLEHWVPANEGEQLLLSELSQKDQLILRLQFELKHQKHLTKLYQRISESHVSQFSSLDSQLMLLMQEQEDMKFQVKDQSKQHQSTQMTQQQTEAQNISLQQQLRKLQEENAHQLQAHSLQVEKLEKTVKQQMIEIKCLKEQIEKAPMSTTMSSPKLEGAQIRVQNYSLTPQLNKSLKDQQSQSQTLLLPNKQLQQEQQSPHKALVSASNSYQDFIHRKSVPTLKLTSPNVINQFFPSEERNIQNPINNIMVFTDRFKLGALKDISTLVINDNGLQIDFLTQMVGEAQLRMKLLFKNKSSNRVIKGSLDLIYPKQFKIVNDINASKIIIQPKQSQCFEFELVLQEIPYQYLSLEYTLSSFTKQIIQLPVTMSKFFSLGQHTMTDNYVNSVFTLSTLFQKDLSKTLDTKLFQKINDKQGRQIFCANILLLQVNSTIKITLKGGQVQLECWGSDISYNRSILQELQFILEEK